MKGREVREALQGSHDPKLVHVIAEIAEDVSSTGQEIQAIATLLNQLVDVIAGMVEVTEATQKAVDSVKNKPKKLKGH